ncbi:MAG: cytidine deaminase [Planctomycetota bacterium]|nr:MAG: cytidine deaminase [Planctomycetota bacterium]
MIDHDALLDAAAAVAANSHSPYSNYKVGSAILCASGKVYSGTNVENSSYGLTICAERAAACHMVAEGDDSIVAVAVWVDATELSSPCGACRQFLSDLAGDDTVVILGCSTGARAEFSLAELLPHPFS